MSKAFELYLAININDSCCNQSNKSGMNTQIKCIAAKSLDDAKKTINEMHPDKTWLVISKECFDNHMVYKAVTENDQSNLNN